MKEKEQWKMKKVLNNRIYYDKFQYFVKWLKYSDTDNEWLKSSELDEIQELIRDFHEKYLDKSAKEKSNKKKSRPDSIDSFGEINLFIYISRWLLHLGHKREIRLNLNKWNSI